VFLSFFFALHRFVFNKITGAFFSQLAEGLKSVLPQLAWP